jgi:hypothetical protein
VLQSKNDHDQRAWCPRCNGKKTLSLKNRSGQFQETQCATCQGEGQIPAWLVMQRFAGIRYRRQREAWNMSIEQRAALWYSTPELVRDLEAGLIKPPFFAPLEPVVTMVMERSYETMRWIARVPRR